MGANLIVSNVRGSSAPMYIAGVRMETMYPMSIITDGIGINFTCVSYADNVDFGVTIEPDLVTRPWAIIDGLDAALKEYLALLPKKTRRKRTATRRPRKTKAVK
jgi:diacylglycerol O-acyltransferase